MELGETDQDPLFKVDKVAKTVAHPFHCFDRIVNTLDNAGRESMSEVVQYILLPVIEHIEELVQMFILHLLGIFHPLI